MHPLFRYDRDEEGKEGRLMAAGRLSRTGRLMDYGQMHAYEEAMEVYDAKYGTR